MHFHVLGTLYPEGLSVTYLKRPNINVVYIGQTLIP